MGLRIGMTVVVPTLREEAHLGYDAVLQDAFGVPVYIQFKRGHKRVKYSKNDRAISNYSLRLPKPFWEFDIHSAAQHNLLCALAARDEAYYFASAFENQLDLYRHARFGSVIQNSAKIDPSLSHTVSDDNHRFVFWPSSRTWDFFSESDGEARALLNEDSISAQIGARLERPRPLQDVFEEIIELARRETQQIVRSTEKIQPELLTFRRAVSALRRLDITLVLFVNRPSDFARRNRLGVPLT